MNWQKNLTNIEPGCFRSLNGAADENIFIGKASKAGFYCFFKVWRDMPYDAVLDYNGILYRIEIKGSGTNYFNFTHGNRSGVQINRNAENRTHLLSRYDGDFVVGVDTNNGDCYIVPMDVIEILGRNQLSKKALEPFKEKWILFIYEKNLLSKEMTRDGLMNLSIDNLEILAQNIGVNQSMLMNNPLNLRGLNITNRRDILIISIWLFLTNL